MRVPGRRAGALAILGTIAFTNCARQRASAGNDEPPVERRRIGHGCKGATVKVRLPLLTQVDQSPAEALREPAAQEAEAAPPEDQQLGERAARAVQRAIEAAIPGTACRLINDRWYWIVECMDEGPDVCGTSVERARHLTEKVRPIVTDAVMVSINNCRCHVYSHRGGD